MVGYFQNPVMEIFSHVSALNKQSRKLDFFSNLQLPRSHALLCSRWNLLNMLEILLRGNLMSSDITDKTNKVRFNVAQIKN